MAFGFGFGMPRIFSASRAFNPASLFANGEQGWWYDPSNFATLFQDSAGTTPVTAVEQPVGLQLDLSKGLVLGPEEVTNGSFTTDTDWTKSAVTVTISGGAVNFISTLTDNGVFQAKTLKPLTLYEYTYTINSITAGAIYLRMGASTKVESPSRTTAGTYTGYLFTPLNVSNFIQLLCSGTTIASADNLSIKEVAGNHRFQTTSANRPVVSARVNLLTKTDSLGPGNGWVTSYTGAWTGTFSTAPDGTQTAMSIKNVSTSANQYFYALSVATGTYRMSVCAKANTGSRISVFEYYTNNLNRVVFDLIGTGSVVSNPSGYPAGITPHPNGGGWYYCYIDLPVSIGTREFDFVPTILNSEVYFWGADLRPTNQGVGLPAYQRVNTSTDYDSTGFPVYIKPNGSNQFMVTNSINFTATDKMTVWQGVRKLSDAAVGIPIELSVDASLNNGAFNVNTSFTGSTNGPNYGLQSKGTTPFTGAYASGYSAPITNVITGIGDISGDRLTLRVNGTQVAQSTADQGTGNYGNYPAYFYMRAGTSLPFNGNDYGSIARGAASTAAQITAGETYINSKTKAF
jgi:hypothetical protein